MEKEYISQWQMGSYPKIVVIFLLGFFPLVGSCLIVCAISVAYSAYAYEGYPLWYALCFFVYALVPSSVCYLVGWAYIEMGLAQYRFAKEGLFARFPLGKEALIPWDSFQQVCVCYAAYTTRGESRANTVICCVKKGEQKNIKGRWKTDSLFHYKSVICIDYRPSLLEGLKAVFPGNVVDLRNTPEYRLKQ